MRTSFRRLHPTPQVPSAGRFNRIKRPLAGALLAALATSGLVAASASASSMTPVVAAASSAAGGGWELHSNGAVTPYGGAAFLGDPSGPVNKPLVGMAATPDGHGYWLVASDGGIFTYGDATFYGSHGGSPLNKPIVGIAATPDGHGYWLVASDGGIFTYGDATFHGSHGGSPLNKPIVGIAATPDGHGYWLVASDGGIFTYGDATFYGSHGGSPLNQPIVGIAATPTRHGYWLVASDGGIFTYGDAPFLGSLGSSASAGTIAGVAELPSNRGYVLVNQAGTVTTYLAGGGPNPAPTNPTVPAQASVPSATWFSASSPFNQAIPAGTPAETVSAGLLSQLAGGATADLYQQGEPIYTDVTPTTPTYHITCTENWGKCPLSQQPVPVPDDATAAPGSDHDITIVDPTTNLAYEFWQATKTTTGWTASWGAVMNLTSLGNHDIYGQPGATGSGLSTIIGVATTTELTNGLIPHALGFSSSLTCPTYIAPATKSDGTGTTPNCIPEGSRIQLDPTINLATIPGITPFELTVGHALQTYGAIAKDTGGAPIALEFQGPQTGQPNPYPSLGAPWDYWNMPHLPWNTLRVITD